VCEEVPENPGASVTNLAEYLAAEVVAQHFPALLDADAEHGQPVRWLERYPPEPGCPAMCDEVTFAPWRIRAAWLGGTLRRTLGTPHWRALSQPEALALAAGTAQGSQQGGGDGTARRVA
jgi:hypothetical protein